MIQRLLVCDLVQSEGTAKFEIFFLLSSISGNLASCPFVWKEQVEEDRKVRRGVR